MTRKADLVIGFFVSIFAGIVYYASSKFAVPELGLGAGGFPKFVAVGLFIFGILLCIRSIIGMRSGDVDKKAIDKKELIDALSLAAAFGLYIFLIKYLGYLITTPIFLFLFMYLYGERKIKRMILVSVVFSIVVYFLFERVFYIMLPSGLLF